MILRAPDGGEHGLVGGRSVLQQRDFVAHHERRADDFLLERNLFVENVEVAGFTLELRHDGGALFHRKRTARAFESR
ncbi:hypothetical protein D3C83_199140 [compost metagenome]